MPALPHQYIDRRSGLAVSEILLADRTVRFIYHSLREKAAPVFKALTGARASALLGWLRYDLALGQKGAGARLIKELGLNTDELLEDAAMLDTPRKVFERQIRYWERRPLAAEADSVVSPCDSRVILGSLADGSPLFIKDKFFDLAELLGGADSRWTKAFQGGDYAVFRLTPEKYHYNHAPVSGWVLDHYGVDGYFHSCNPEAVLSLAAPYSKNRRVVTIIDSDGPGGSGAGLVGMVEVVALMIGEVVQCYSEQAYEDPQPVLPGLWLKKGQPKSLFRPGSSTVVLLFQPGRVRFDQDILDNLVSPGVATRFSQGLGRPLVETEVEVRSRIGRARGSGQGRGLDDGQAALGRVA